MITYHKYYLWNISWFRPTFANVLYSCNCLVSALCEPHTYPTLPSTQPLLYTCWLPKMNMAALFCEEPCTHLQWIITFNTLYFAYSFHSYLLHYILKTNLKAQCLIYLEFLLTQIPYLKFIYTGKSLNDILNKHHT